MPKDWTSVSWITYTKNVRTSGHSISQQYFFIFYFLFFYIYKYALIYGAFYDVLFMSLNIFSCHQITLNYENVICWYLYFNETYHSYHTYHSFFLWIADLSNAITFTTTSNATYFQMKQDRTTVHQTKFNNLISSRNMATTKC